MATNFYWGAATSAGHFEGDLGNDRTVFSTTPNSIAQMIDMAKRDTASKTIDPKPASVARRHVQPAIVRGDLDRFFARLAPEGDPLFRHRDERADDSRRICACR